MSSRLAACALTSLTRRWGGLSLGGSSCRPVSAAPWSSFSTLAAKQRLRVMPTSLPTCIITPALSFGFFDYAPSVVTPFSQTTTRTMVTRKKRLARRVKRRLEAKIASRKEEELAKGGGEREIVEQAAPQHEAWVDFQKSIRVGSFQTGQVTKARVQQKGESGQKLRDLKRREKMEMRRQNIQADVTDVRGGEYPALRYSDEETERLLKMAYAAIPPRAGKRGTRNLKRQKRRWFLVRKIHAKAKYQRKMAHFRAMAKLSKKFKEVKAVKRQSAQVRAKDREYQQEVLRRWAQNLQRYNEEDAHQELVQAEAIEQQSKA